MQYNLIIEFYSYVHLFSRIIIWNHSYNPPNLIDNYSRTTKLSNAIVLCIVHFQTLIYFYCSMYGKLTKYISNTHLL